MSTDGKKLSELDPLPLPALPTDEAYVIRSGLSYRQDLSDVPLTPSGNPATDAANIQAAIDAASAMTTIDSAILPEVRLSGDFQIDTPLLIGGADPTSTTPEVALVGAPSARITWAGASQDDYMLRYHGHRGNTDPPQDKSIYRIQNVHFDGADNSRGVSLSRCNYWGAIRSVHIYNTIRVGLDVIDCWASHMRDVLVTATSGFAARFARTNSCTLESFRFRVDSTSTLDADWPTSTTDPNGPFRQDGSRYASLVTQRSCVLYDQQNAVNSQNWVFENCLTDSYPIWLCYGTNNLSAVATRWEECEANLQYLKLQFGRKMFFDDHYIQVADPSTNTCPYFATVQNGAYESHIVDLYDNGTFDTAGVAYLGDVIQDFHVDRMTFGKGIKYEQFNSGAIRYPSNESRHVTFNVTTSGDTGSQVIFPGMVAGELVHNVTATVIDTAPLGTLSVGIGGNINKYIASGDLDLSTIRNTTQMLDSTAATVACEELLLAGQDLRVDWSGLGAETASVRVTLTYTPRATIPVSHIPVLSAANAPNGTLFEDGGQLVWKASDGTITLIATPP